MRSLPFIFEDNLKISRQSSIRQCVVRTLPFMNCPTIANGQTCPFYYLFASVSSSSSQYLLASQFSVRMLVALTKHWSDWCCLLLPDNCFRTCTMLPMLTMYTCEQKHDDLASHGPLPCTREKRAKSMFDGFTFSYGFLFSCIAGSRATLCTDHKIDSPIKIEKKPVLQFQTEPPVQAPVQAGS